MIAKYAGDWTAEQIEAGEAGDPVEGLSPAAVRELRHVEDRCDRAYEQYRQARQRCIELGRVQGPEFERLREESDAAHRLQHSLFERAVREVPAAGRGTALKAALWERRLQQARDVCIAKWDALQAAKSLEFRRADRHLGDAEARLNEAEAELRRIADAHGLQLEAT